MRRFSVVVGLALLAGVVAGCFEQGGGARSYKGPLFRYHYAGRANLPAGTNASEFKKIDALPATAEFRSHVATKLAGSAVSIWKNDLPAGVSDQRALLKPLLEDFFVAEAYVEVRGAPGKAETALAIQLTDDRARLWESNLRQLLGAWKLGTPKEVTIETVKGWEVKRAQAPNTFQFARTGKWVLLGLGQDRLTMLPSLLQTAAKSGRPLPSLTNAFLELSADLPGLRPWLGVFAQYPLPPIVATMSPKGEYVRTEVRFQYSGKVPWTYEPFKFPTNLISEPLNSFTLAQGIAPLVKSIKGFEQLGLQPVPNQLCAWGVRQDQCRLFFAIPVPNATNALRKLAPTLPLFVRSHFTNMQGDFLYISNRAELMWGNLPFIAPHIRPEKDATTEYLYGGIFPHPRTHTPMPEPLIAQVRGRTNLVYYDWEITEDRLNHSRQLYQLAALAAWRKPGTNSPSRVWLDKIGSLLGNTITEVTQTNSTELFLARKSHLGFTGIELATLSAWLDSPEFPFRISAPPSLPGKPPKSPAAEALSGATQAAPQPAPARNPSPGQPPKRP
jgi:hypothetical protein